jgi:hypothetical protein
MARPEAASSVPGMRIPAMLLLAAGLAAGDATAPPELAGLPTHVARNANLWFDEGRLQGGQDGLQVGLQAKLGERLRVVEVLGVELIEALGDDGKPLRLQEDGNSSGGGGGEPGLLDVTVSFNPPGAGVRLIRSLAVAVRCRIAAEGLRRTSIKPARDWIAKRMRIDGLDGGEVELENLGAETLTLGMTPALEKAVESLVFRTASGDEVEQRGWNDSQEPGWVARVIDVSLPSDGAIVLDLRQELGERRYVIRAKDIPITLPDRVKEPVGVLTTEPVIDGENPVEPAAPPLPLPKPGF